MDGWLVWLTHELRRIWADVHFVELNRQFQWHVQVELQFRSLQYLVALQLEVEFAFLGELDRRQPLADPDCLVLSRAVVNGLDRERMHMLYEQNLN